jgi:hypothetical protein
LTWKRDEKGKSNVDTGGAKLQTFHVFPGGSKLVVLEKAQPPGRSENARSRLELQGLAGGKRRVLIEDCRPLIWMFPSPDGKLVALLYETRKPDEVKIRILDAMGTTVADVEVKE